MSTQRVPAWKRLGLKLKGHAPEESPAGNTPHQSDGAGVEVGAANANKRKQPPARDSEPNKKLRRNGVLSTSAAGQQGAAPIKKQKSVTFAVGVDEKRSVPQPNGKKTAPARSKPKTKKPEKDRTKPAKDFDLGPSISYLREWHTARDQWKFNKNHQTLLIKYVFDGERIPSADVPIFYAYIRDLKGFVRTRLYETAVEIKRKDMEQGLAAFPEAVQDKEGKQKEYEDVISRFLDGRNEAREAQIASSSNRSRKRSFDEVEFVLRIADPTVRERACKRIRAEQVQHELSDSAETTTTTTTTAGGTAPSTAQDSVGGSAMDIEETNSLGKGIAPQGQGTGPAKKVRTPGAEKAEGSSKSDTDEESSSDESSSEDSDDEDAEADQAAILNGQESSSSSSSSSSEGEEEDEEEDSSDEE